MFWLACCLGFMCTSHDVDIAFFGIKFMWTIEARLEIPSSSLTNMLGHASKTSNRPIDLHLNDLYIRPPYLSA